MARGPYPGFAVGALAFAQVVAWGILYYAVLVAAPAIADDTGWSTEAIFAAITAGLLTSALCAIPVGRWLDRRPRTVMVVGAVVGCLALLVASFSPSIWVFAASWIVCGAAQACVLYQAAFTVITHRYQSRRRGPLTLVTLAGGLASTAFAPLTGWLILEFGWRSALILLASVLAAVLIPIYGLTIERRWTRHEAHTIEVSAASSRKVLQSTRFWVLTSSFALMSFALYAVTLSAVPAGVEKGLDLQSAAWAFGLIGAGQVLGRLIYLVVPHSASPWIAPTSVGLLGAGALVAYGLASGVATIYLTAVLAGAIRGALTLVQASAVADRWGSQSYGRLNGTLAAPVAFLTAFAPVAAAMLATAAGSFAVVAFVMAALCGVGALLAIRR